MSEQMIDAVTFPDGARVLELGGGENRHSQSSVMVDVRPGPMVDFPVDLNSVPLPIAPDDFDIIFSQFVLEHLPFTNVLPLLKDCHRIVRPGGAVVFVVPNTEEQLRWIQKHPDGWNGKDFYTSASELLFGSQTYAANFHAAYFSADVAVKLFTEAGFEQVQTLRFGSAGTDMLIRARKALVQSDAPAVVQPKAPSIVETVPAEELFDRHYFHGGAKVGGYAHEGYRNFACQEVTFRHIMEHEPQSVLELGAARGYIGKRLEDSGVRYCGLEVSQHCWMTRACKGVRRQNLTEGNWELPYNVGDDLKWDFGFSIATFEHIPENKVDHVLEQLKLNTKRGLHGIDSGHEDDSFDKTHCNLKPLSWWRRKFDEHGLQDHIIVEKNQLEVGDYQHGVPKDYLQGDGKVKIEVGSHIMMSPWGWANIDIHDLNGFAQQNGYAFIQHDASKSLPFHTGKVDLIHHSHFLEHLPLDAGVSFLRECRRVIKRDGAMRIAVPDAALLMQKYLEGTLGDYHEISDGCEAAKTQAAKLWELLMAGHQCLYDADTLCWALRESGWKPQVVEFRETKLGDKGKQILRETLDAQPCISLYVEAEPLLG